MQKTEKINPIYEKKFLKLYTLLKLVSKNSILFLTFFNIHKACKQFRFKLDTRFYIFMFIAHSISN